jgi:hypothetical protein
MNTVLTPLTIAQATEVPAASVFARPINGEKCGLGQRTVSGVTAMEKVKMRNCKMQNGRVARLFVFAYAVV